MNLGVYIQSLADNEKLKEISDAINNNLSTGILNDASLFYDNVAYNHYKFRCGLFNSTDLWNFNGKLITTSLSTTISSLKIVNKIQIYYYYGFEENISPLSLMYIIKNYPDLVVIANSEKTNNDFYRKTSIKPSFISSSFMELIEKIR